MPGSVPESDEDEAKEKISVSIDAEVYDWVEELRHKVFGNRSKIVELALKRFKRDIEAGRVQVDELLELSEE